MADKSYYVHDLDPLLIAFPEWFPLDGGIHWYGLSYVAGFFSAFGLLAWYYRKGRSPMDADARMTFMTASIVGILLGGRLGYMLLYDMDKLLNNPSALYRVWEGGMASHGGFVGVALGLWWFSRKSKISLLRLGDFAVTIAAPGLFCVRIANFINGELWGKVSEVSHAIVFPLAQGPAYFDHSQYHVFSETLGRLVNPRHPSQLYEAALEGLLLFVVTQWRFWKFPKLAKGQLAGEFFIAYAILRVIGEAGTRC